MLLCNQCLDTFHIHCFSGLWVFMMLNNMPCDAYSWSLLDQSDWSFLGNDDSDQHDEEYADTGLHRLIPAWEYAQPHPKATLVTTVATTPTTWGVTPSYCCVFLYAAPSPKNLHNWPPTIFGLRDPRCHQLSPEYRFVPITMGLIGGSPDSIDISGRILSDSGKSTSPIGALLTFVCMWGLYELSISGLKLRL